MINIIQGEHHYQRQINHPVDRAQEGFDYYDYIIETSGNIAEEIPHSLYLRLLKHVQGWDPDKIDIVEIQGCKFRVDGALVYIEHLDGNLSALLDDTEIQEALREGTQPYI